jgi:hypothetical protein
MNYCQHRTTILLSFFLFLPYSCMGMKPALGAGPQAPTAPKSYRFICDDQIAKVLSSPDTFFHKLPAEVLTKIVAQTNNRNALRKTCTLLATFSSTNNRPALVLHQDFTGSTEDVIKACEHWIEADDHISLRTAIVRYGLDMLSGTNIIGYSLEEYALLLDKGNCLALLSTSAKHDVLPSLKDRCNVYTATSDDDESETDAPHTIECDATMIAEEKLFTKLLDAIYVHKVKKNDATINYYFSQKALAKHGRYGDQYAQSPGHIAAYNGDNALIEKLLVLKPNYDRIETTKHNYEPLGIACIRGYPLCVQTLLLQGAYPEQDIDTEDSMLNIKSPLCDAAQRGFTECARLLLDSKKLWEEKEQCQMALLYATQSGCAELVELLLEQGTNPNIDGDAIEYFYNDETIIAQKAPCAAQPIDLATHYGDHTIATKLIAAGALATKYETPTSCCRTFIPHTPPATEANTNS